MGCLRGRPRGRLTTAAWDGDGKESAGKTGEMSPGLLSFSSTSSILGMISWVRSLLGYRKLKLMALGVPGVCCGDSLDAVDGCEEELTLNRWRGVGPNTTSAAIWTGLRSTTWKRFAHVWRRPCTRWECDPASSGGEPAESESLSRLRFGCAGSADAERSSSGILAVLDGFYVWVWEGCISSLALRTKRPTGTADVGRTAGPTTNDASAQ
jgi:hypothetical protein